MTDSKNFGGVFSPHPFSSSGFRSNCLPSPHGEGKKDSTIIRVIIRGEVEPNANNLSVIQQPKTKARQNPAKANNFGSLMEDNGF